jgi:hypothetical protein
MKKSLTYIETINDILTMPFRVDWKYAISLDMSAKEFIESLFYILVVIVCFVTFPISALILMRIRGRKT